MRLHAAASPWLLRSGPFLGWSDNRLLQHGSRAPPQPCTPSAIAGTAIPPLVRGTTRALTRSTVAQARNEFPPRSRICSTAPTPPNAPMSMRRRRQHGDRRIGPGGLGRNTKDYVRNGRREGRSDPAEGGRELSAARTTAIRPQQPRTRRTLGHSHSHSHESGGAAPSFPRGARRDVRLSTVSRLTQSRCCRTSPGLPWRPPSFRRTWG
jgi:hypothetical protein